MRRKTTGRVLGLLLCLMTLAIAVVLQHSGYLTYLNSDMSSEVILAKRQADTGSLVQMDWLYSTEIHTLHMNLLYALAFFVTPSFEWARIIGNTLGFVLGMGALVYLLRVLKLSWGATLCTAALLPVAAGTLYASNMTIGGYYIVHLSLGFLLAGLWLSAGERGGLRIPAFAALCLLEGFLSVRYVLCFVCPMLACALLDAIFAREESLAQYCRFAAITCAGFVACVMGYGASEIIMPHLFVSGAGGASSFVFNPLDGPAMFETLATVFADMLKLLGWRGGAPLFSAAGIVNLGVAAVLFFGGALLVRALCRGHRAAVRDMTRDGELGTRQNAAFDARRMMLLYACAVFLVNLFCFLFIQGTYLNRYLILAVIFFVPALPVVIAGEKNARLSTVFLLVLCAWLALASALTLVQTREAENDARKRSAGMLEAIETLAAEGYTHGYGTFWNVRVMQERSQGALTFTGVAPVSTEENALTACAPEFIRWLEPDEASALDVCMGKTFLILTHDEAGKLEDWLKFAGTSVIFKNTGFVAYSFPSSETLVTAMLLGKATLDAGDLPGGAAQAQEGNGISVTIGEGGRLRIPPTYFAAGNYELSFTCEGEIAQGSVVRAYTGARFELLDEQPLVQGENSFRFALGSSDKYFMLQILAGEAKALTVGDIRLECCD